MACENRRGIRFERISGIIHRPQQPATLAALRDELSAKSSYALTALFTLASVSASLIAALAVADDPTTAEPIFADANLEEDWQAQNWGRDEEADKGPRGAPDRIHGGGALLGIVAGRSRSLGQCDRPRG